MSGTLLAYDDAFPRARVPAGPIRNTPGADELRANGYPAPYRLLPIWEASRPETYLEAISDAAEAMGTIDCFILFGHGRVVNALEARRTVRVTTGIIIGASDITASNASGFRALRGNSRAGRERSCGSARRQRRARPGGIPVRCCVSPSPTPSASR
jgi:hypothetical protein